jgi:hypothetical protein
MQSCLAVPGDALAGTREWPVGESARIAIVVRALGGADGNERLSVALGVPLVVLLALEVLTTLDLPSYLSVHMFLGLVLLPAVSLKVASTSWHRPPLELVGGRASSGRA